MRLENSIGLINNGLSWGIDEFNKLSTSEKIDSAIVGLAYAHLSPAAFSLVVSGACRWGLDGYKNIKKSRFNSENTVKRVQGSSLKLDVTDKANTLKLSPKDFLKRLKTNDIPKDGKVVVQGDLIIENKGYLNFLPANLKVEGDVEIIDCRNLDSLPQGLTVEGNLYLEDLSIEELPENLKLEGSLHLQDLPKLTSLPPSLTEVRYLWLQDLPKLTSLPPSLTEVGDLFLARLPINELPENLIVKGDFRLYGCSNLTSLPPSLSVLGKLELSDLQSLASLSESLTVGGHIAFRNLPNLTSLPSSINEWGPLANGEDRMIELENTGLSDTVLENLRQSDHPGIQFHDSQRAEEPGKRFSSIEEGLHYWAKFAKESDVPQLEVSDHPDQVISFLSRLTSTQEYKNPQSRPVLARRIIDMFQLVSQDPEIKELAVNHIFHALSSCDDRIISAFNDMELMIEVQKIEKGNHTEQELKELAKSFMLLDMVNRKAEEHVKSLPYVDEIEVYLAFQLGLADRFELPIKTRNMIFRNCAQISDDKIEEIGNQIEQDSTDEKLEAFLETWSPWIKHQKEAQIPTFESLAVDTETSLDKDTVCPITQEEPEQPVSYQGTVYDYESFIEHFKVNGKNPMNPSEAIDIKQLKRVA